MKPFQNDKAVSEILGAMLLLLIAVGAFSLVYFQFMSDEGPAEETHVNIIGDIAGGNIVLTHIGGESLTGDTMMSFSIPGEIKRYSISEIFDLSDTDTNGNGNWDFGEELVFKFIDDLNSDEFLDNIDQYEFINAQAVDTDSNAIKFQGPVNTKYRSDLGVYLSVDNYYPENCGEINIAVTVVCYGGDVNAAGGVNIHFELPDDFILVDEPDVSIGTYNLDTGIWHLGNIRVGEYYLNVTVEACTSGYYEPTQLGILLEGSDYTSGSNSVFKNTYLNGLMFALAPEKFGIIPHDGSVELTLVACGWDDPPRAEVLLNPTTIETEEQAKKISSGQGIRNDDCPGGKAPIASGIKYLTDMMFNSDNYTKDKRQIILLITSTNLDCLENDTSENPYDAIPSANMQQIKDETIEARTYLYNRLNLTLGDEFNAISVTKDNSVYRDSTFLKDNIVIPQPGKIYDISHPIVSPGWVYEVEPGKEAFQQALNLILELLLNSVRLDLYVQDSTTVDPFSGNNEFIVFIEPTTPSP